jgi:hypothetical protein
MCVIELAANPAIDGFRREAKQKVKVAPQREHSAASSGDC